MRISRGPRTTGNRHETDSKALAEWAKDWKPGKKLSFDGTIDKSGTKHTELDVEIETVDIISLIGPLLNWQNNRVRVLKEQKAKQTDTIKVIETALRKINRLTLSKTNYAANSENLLKIIGKIATHFQSSFTRHRPLDLGEIKYDDI